MQVSETVGNLIPLSQKLVTKSCMGDYVKMSSGHDYLFSPPLPPICGNAYQVTQLVFLREGHSFDAVQPNHLHRFLRSLHQMTSFYARMCILAVSKKQNFTFWPHFPPKNGNLGPIFSGTRKILAKKCLNMKDFTSKHPFPDHSGLCEVLSAFPQHVLPLLCNVCISVTSQHCQSDVITVSYNYRSSVIVVV